jgi:prophage regulatory protein
MSRVPPDQISAEGSANPRRRLVRYAQLDPEYGIPWSRMHCDRLERAGKFPRKVRIGPNTIGYWSDEIEAFLEVRSAAAVPPLPNELEKARAAMAAKRAKLKAAKRKRGAGAETAA